MAGPALAAGPLTGSYAGTMGEDPKRSLDADVIVLENDGPLSSTICTIKAKRTSLEPSQMIPLCAM